MRKVFCVLTGLALASCRDTFTGDDCQSPRLEQTLAAVHSTMS